MPFGASCRGINFLHITTALPNPLLGGIQIRQPIPVGVQLSEAALLLGSRVRFPLTAWMLVPCVYFVLCRKRPLRQADQSYRVNL